MAMTGDVAARHAENLRSIGELKSTMTWALRGIIVGLLALVAYLLKVELRL